MTRRLETDDYLQKIKDAGIVGVGGADLTERKVSTQIPGGYLIANAAECEPILGTMLIYGRNKLALFVENTLWN